MNNINNVKKRIDIIDALRGLAMFGIMIVNFPSMNTYVGQETYYYGGVSTFWDKIAAQINFIIFNEKFYPIFSLLFGLSLFIFYNNIKDKNLNPNLMTIKRLTGLMCFGLLHVLFVWWGDVLFIYAALGFLALLFMERSSKTIFCAMCALLVGYPLFKIALTSFGFLKGIGANDPILTGIGIKGVNQEFLLEVYSHGSFLDISKQRLIDYMNADFELLTKVDDIHNIIFGNSFYIQLFGSILLGMFVGKMGWHKNILNLNTQIHKVWLLMAFISASFIFLTSLESLTFLFVDLKNMQNEFLSLFYTLSFVLFLKHIRGTSFYSYIEAVGKMSLTAYLAHTIVGSILLYGYGFALFEKVGPTALFLVSIATYCSISIFCKLWLQQFQFGPVEYIWRQATYFTFRKPKAELET